MHKADSMDLTSRVKLLLELMTKNSMEESHASDEDYFTSSDTSDTEHEDSDKDHRVGSKNRQNFSNGRHCDKTVLFNKFFKENEGNKKKFSPSTTPNSIWNNYQFEEKMYRVIPLRLDQNVCKSISQKKHTIKSNK